MKQRTKQIGGEYWFSAKYAAELLGTTRKTIEAMAVREVVRAIDAESDCYVAETDVTRLRRSPDDLKQAKAVARMPAHPRRSEVMPKGTPYVGEHHAGARTPTRVGNPLKDERLK